MRIINLHDFEICMRLEKLSKRHNIKLTLAQKKLYIDFIKFCEDKGLYDENGGHYYLSLTISEMSHEFAAGKTTVTNALKALSGCGAVIRVKSSSVKNNEASGVITNVNVDFLADDKIC